MRTVLFVSSTPLHSLWSLALATGPLADARCVLWTFDRGGDQPDFIVEALRGSGTNPFAAIEKVDSVSRKRLPEDRDVRGAMRELGQRVRALAPDTIFAGNDRTRQFQGIARAAPRAGIVYLDDGTGSYVPLPPRTPRKAIREQWHRVKRWFRYGFTYYKPNQLGMTARVSEAWVAFPAHVHPGLAARRLHRIEPEWLRATTVQGICTQAVRLAGFEADVLSGVELLLLLPRESQIDATPGLREQLESLVRAVHSRGGRVAIKRHPRSAAIPLAIDLDSCIEIPSRLPIEILAPLLRGMRVVGAMTSALIFLPWLGADVRVESIVPSGVDPRHPVLGLYAALGIPGMQVGARSI